MCSHHSTSRTSNTSTQQIGRHTSSTCASDIHRTFNPSTQPIGTQVPVHPRSAELPTLQPNLQAHKYLCIQDPQNFQHFNPTDRHTSTCAFNIRRTSNTSTQPIGIRRTSNTSTQPTGTQVPVHSTSAELPTLQPNR